MGDRDLTVNEREKEAFRETVAALKQEPGKDRLLLESGRIVSALAHVGLRTVATALVELVLPTHERVSAGASS